MPLSSRGSVSARLSVWFSLSSAARNAAGSATNTSIPPASCSPSDHSPCTRWIAARRLVPASVSTIVPLSSSNAASPCLPAPRTRRFPVQTPGDHQMDHEKEIALERKDDPLADTPDARDLAPVRGGKRRLHRAQDEGMEQLHALETHPDDARRQRVE